MDMSFNQPGVFAPTDFGAGLRPFSWHELCSRIAAVQDLRRAMALASASEHTISTGSFHGQAALIMARTKTDIAGQTIEGERLVNPVSSANCKTQASITSQTEGRFATGPR